MGLLGGIGKKKQPAEPKQAKVGKKDKGGKLKLGGKGKKKDMTLIELMQLEESVAAASLEVVQELANSGGAAVREIEDGLLIVVFTNENLEESGLDPAGEEFGSFAEALRSETVESIALAKDLTAGIIGIIPSQETLLSLDEFDFVQDLMFKWAIVPFDLGDADQLMVLDDTVHIARLTEIAGDDSIKLTVKNGRVVEEEEAYDEEPEEEYSNMDVDEDELPDDVDEEFEPDEPMDDEFDPGLDDEDELDDDLPSGTYGDLPHDDAFDDVPDDEPYSFDAPEEDEVYEVEQELMPLAESKEAINRVVQHSFNNPELNLTIDMAKFDDYFDSVELAQFDTVRTDDSELQKVSSLSRQDANTELKRFRQDNLTALRNKYTTSMRDIHNRLVESLDHKDEGTTYGERYLTIESSFNDSMRDVDRTIAGEVAKLTADYKEVREEYGENAKREAYSVYDSRYRSDLDRKILAVRSSVPADLKNERDSHLGELYDDRRTIAQRLFDKATTALLQTLQEEYQQIAQKELRMYDVFRKDMDVYLRKHFADEVLRAKAEAEKLRQSHEADSIRQQYKQMMDAKEVQLQQETARAHDMTAQMNAAHSAQLQEVKADYDKRLEREKKESNELRHLLERSNESTTKISEQKDKEIAHQMTVLNNQIKGQAQELEYANARNARTQKPLYLAMGAAAMIALMFGVIAGFLFGAGTTEVAPAPQMEQASDTVSYFSAPSVEAFATEYDHLDAA